MSDTTHPTDIPPGEFDGEGDTCDVQAAAPLVAGMMPLSAGLPPYDEDASVLVYTGHDDFGGVQFHQVKVLDLYPPQHEEQRSDEVADAATHWMPLPLPGRAQPARTPLDGAQPPEPAREPSDEEIVGLWAAAVRAMPPADLEGVQPRLPVLPFARAVRAWRPAAEQEDEHGQG